MCGGECKNDLEFWISNFVTRRDYDLWDDLNFGAAGRPIICFKYGRPGEVRLRQVSFDPFFYGKCCDKRDTSHATVGKVACCLCQCMSRDTVIAYANPFVVGLFLGYFH